MNFDLNEFFYNIVPGSMFLIFWYLKIDNLRILFSSMSKLFADPLIFGIILLFIALALGLILHGVWRTIKYFILLRCERNNSEEYDENAYLWAEEKRKLPEYFSARSAVWSSFIIGLVISLFLVREYWLYYLLLIFVFGFMYYADYIKEKNAIKRTYQAIKPRIKK